MILSLLLLASGADGYRVRDLRDDDLIRFQAATYDKSLLQGTRVIIGRHHGATVVADFPCSDVCPNYTTRIVHYELEPGQSCTGIGGVERWAMVPAGVAAHRDKFCVPEVLGTELIREGD